MRLKTISLMGLFSFIFLTILFAYSLYIVAVNHTELMNQEILSEKLSNGVHDLSVLTSDFLLYRNERARQQWLKLHRTIRTTILQQEPYLSEKDMASLYNNYLNSQKLFQQIIMADALPVDDKQAKLASFREKVLIDQLQKTLQAMSSTARQLSLLFHEQLNPVVFRIKLINAVMVIVIVLVIGSYWFILKSRIIGPVNSLREEIQDFSGDINRRLSIKRNDEIGIMAAAFNQMADQLTETMVTRDKMDHQAHHDALTGLPNRLLFMDRLNQSIKQALRNNSKTAVIFIDLDRFKEINDSLGHKVGDEVLIHISQRLLRCMRDSDTVSRLGGDEFMMVLNDIRETNDIADIVTKIMDILLSPIPIMDHQLYITLSVGISIFPDDADNPEALIRNADTAMYKAKEEGRNTYRYYTEDMTRKAFEHIRLESSLRRALEKDELTLYFQPQVNIRNMEIIALEALARWQHNKLGIIPPGKFMPLAEETGIIIPMGERLLDKACKQISQWVNLYDQTIRVSVNLSILQLQQAECVEKLVRILERNNCRPQWLEVEVTEKYLMKNPQKAIDTLNEISAMGIAITIDDFGTGYSSLSFLKKLPVSKLKIDKSFIQDLNNDEDDRAIIKAIISLAKNMNFKVIAEGVETQEQKQFLQEQGCHHIQGRLYGNPVDSKKMTEILIHGLEYSPL